MEFIKEKNRIYSVDLNNNIICEINFIETKKGVYTITHTFVDETLRGKGIAKKLVEMAIEEIKNKGAIVNATCSFAKKYLEKNN